ncbi:unnamed protein product [Heligmosomoides polygyrus]|uniref:Endo/exonuclease/phosphatase domain-containing protein n=1 Tax=Heligmosomoides polygyrus TaxID=6339 RepID=A0A183G4I3_HELPZ|nr:unnamed protein product [Heligmosomoides polygyrus]
MAVPSPGATGNCSLLRAELNTDIECRRQALVTGQPTNILCHIIWLMTLQNSRDNATASAGADAHLVRKSSNVSSTRETTLNVGTLTGRSYEVAEALQRRRVDFCAMQEVQVFLPQVEGHWLRLQHRSVRQSQDYQWYRYDRLRTFP